MCVCVCVCVSVSMCVRVHVRACVNERDQTQILNGKLYNQRIQIPPEGTSQ